MEGDYHIYFVFQLMGQLVYYFVTMVAIVVLVSLQIPTFTCDLGYIVVVHNHTKPKTSIY